MCSSHDTRPRAYQMQDSGNCYKARLAIAHQQLPCEMVPIDILTGESRTPAFLARNSNGRVPTLELTDGTFLPESNAIPWYLAEDTILMTGDPLSRAQALRWMFFEQYSHEPFIATIRFWLALAPDPESHRVQIDERRPGGYAALDVMEQHLGAHDFFAGDYSIADIALYAYIHVAEEGDFDLSGYPRIHD